MTIIPAERCLRNQNDTVALVRWSNLRHSQREVAFAYARAEQKHPDGVWLSVSTMMDHVSQRRRELDHDRDYRPIAKRTFLAARSYLASDEGNVLIRIGTHVVTRRNQLPIFVINAAELWDRNLKCCTCKGQCCNSKTYRVQRSQLRGAENGKICTQYISNGRSPFATDNEEIPDWEIPF